MGPRTDFNFGGGNIIAEIMQVTVFSTSKFEMLEQWLGKGELGKKQGGLVRDLNPGPLAP
jgi:hypothetical protein